MWSDKLTIQTTIILMQAPIVLHIQQSTNYFKLVTKSFGNDIIEENLRNIQEITVIEETICIVTKSFGN